jgi:DDE superfamily endonuclease
MFDPARLVFIDETCTNTAMVRLRGRAPRGARLVDYAPQGHWKTITFVGGLRQRAMTAPFVLEGAMNGPMFLAYVKQCLNFRRRSSPSDAPSNPSLEHQLDAAADVV